MLPTLLTVVAILAFPFAAPAQTKVFDLTPAFVDCGADIEELLVYRVGGIVLIRGTTSDAAKAADVGRIPTFLGYDRVANLIRVIDEGSADALIEARGRRQLDLEPMLQGCKFQIDSTLGDVRVGGKVKREAQKFLAVEILLRVTGVKEVQWDQR
ncbi:MAG TPA: BON domain-containing protein [Thermoanaerobaculia bacterium]|nr:BON domain-containing protein [Thermoanaerobaculia bacterium]